MKIKVALGFLSILAIAAFSIIGSTGCANIIPPQGGPRDSLPPVLLKADPVDSARNFSETRITFSFDEYVDVQDVYNNLLVSPLPKNLPDVDYKLRTVTVKLKDSLEKNTTYTLNFGDALKDVNEGNIYKNFTYTFSTGSYLDSLELSGKVILAENGRIDTTLIVMLHTSSDDSIVVKEKPRYITKLDSKGRFHFKNLPPKTFYIYALKDEGITRRYLSGKQLFGFADKPVDMQAKNDSLTLYAYIARRDKPAVSSQPTATAPKPRAGATADNRLKFSNNLSNGQQDLLGNFEMVCDKSLKVFDTSKIKLYTDSAFNPAKEYSFIKDSTGKKILLNITWQESTQYHIIMDKDFAEDSSGKKLFRTDTLSFTTKKKSDYGSLKLKLRNLDLTKNPVLQIMNGENIFKSVTMTSTEFNSPMFLPGEYELRILFDNNKNGTWDPGDFFGKHIQPELVLPIERKITVKPNWQNEVEIASPL